MRAQKWGAARALLLACLLPIILLAGTLPAHALKTIPVGNDQERIEITGLGEAYEPRGDILQIETAPGADGSRGRMSVRAATPGTNPAWFVFALTNATDKSIERYVAADRYGIVGSGVVWPDLDARRIDAVTPSVGYVPERIKNDRADVFRVTLEPGQTVTFVAELASDRFARIFLWKPIEYEQRSRDRQLFNGIMLGITGLLAIFLTAVFAANHKAIFPTAAIFTWCVLAYLCVDFGFWHKLFNVRPEENAQYRAATEAGMAATLLIFLYTFLRLGAWHGFVRMLLVLWVTAQLVLVAVAFIDPRLAATFARLSSVLIGGAGAGLTLFLAMRGQDRAVSLVPVWILLLVWLFGAGVMFTGKLSGDIVVFGLTGGLVLIVVLIGFTVTQYAFRSLEPLYGAQPGEQQLRSLAVDAAGTGVWEWSDRRNEIKVSPLVDTALGLKPGELSTKLDDFARHMHATDRERLKLLLESVKERTEGEIRIEFRMRHADSSYRWFGLEAASVPTSDRRSVRCVGLIREITDTKLAQERLLHDAVHDSLSGLPNRELFLDRLAIVAKRATLEPLVRPALLFIDIDRFKAPNPAAGMVVGDSLLLTVARRLSRNLGPQDTLARVGADQFALLFISQSNPSELAMIAEQVRRSLRAPINISGEEVVLGASIGIALYDGPDEDPAELLREAEIAMYRAKRGGADRIEIFNPAMRTEKDSRPSLEGDLRRALEKRQLRLVYQPIYYLPTQTLAGFEALVRWDHPTLGSLSPAQFVPIAEETDLIGKLGAFVLARAVREAVRWQKEMPRPDAPVFVGVNVSSRQLFRPELVKEVRRALSRAVLPRGSLRLEITESLVMENPEKATAVMRELADAGAHLALDDFGTGYSSLSYLNQFTFNTIKVDRSFLQTNSENGAGPVILRSVVALAHELGKNVVAEGVETEDDVALLRTIGCEYGQGFYYGEPMSERDAMQHLKMARRSERRMKRRSLLRKRERPAADDEIADDVAPPPPAPAPARSVPRAPPPADIRAAAPRTGPPPAPPHSPAAGNGHANGAGGRMLPPAPSGSAPRNRPPQPPSAAAPAKDAAPARPAAASPAPAGNAAAASSSLPPTQPAAPAPQTSTGPARGLAPPVPTPQAPASVQSAGAPVKVPVPPVRTAPPPPAAPQSPPPPASVQASANGSRPPSPEARPPPLPQQPPPTAAQPPGGGRPPPPPQRPARPAGTPPPLPPGPPPAPRTGPPPLPVGQPVNTGFAPASPPAQSPPRRSSPDFSNLPPAIAESLAKLAGQLAGGSTSNSGNGGGDGNPPG